MVPAAPPVPPSASGAAATGDVEMALGHGRNAGGGVFGIGKPPQLSAYKYVVPPSFKNADWWNESYGGGEMNIDLSYVFKFEGGSWSQMSIVVSPQEDTNATACAKLSLIKLLVEKTPRCWKDVKDFMTVCTKNNKKALFTNMMWPVLQGNRDTMTLHFTENHNHVCSGYVPDTPREFKFPCTVERLLLAARSAKITYSSKLGKNTYKKGSSSGVDPYGGGTGAGAYPGAGAY